MAGKNTEDPWGRDPQVQYLRKVFSCIEEMQKNLLQQLKVSPFDYRLPRVREATLSLFEKAWVIASRKGLAQKEDEVALLYLYIFARILRANRISVPEDILPPHKEIASVVKEVFS